jgi:hypothetical protein
MLRGKRRVDDMHVLVSGMHRSGTSAVTRAINLLGVPLGRAEGLYVDPGNPTGYWESTTLCICNDMILARFRGTWFLPPRLVPGWELSNKAEAMRPHLNAAIAEVFDTESWVWKDPRLSLTMPLWKTLVPEICSVIVVRNPVAVSKSLRRRDGYPAAHCRALWDVYNRHAFAATKGLPTIIVDFDRVLADPEGAVGWLAQALRRHDVEVTHSTAEAAKAIVPGAVRVAPAERSSTATRGLWQELQHRAGDQDAVGDLGPSPAWVRAELSAARTWSRRPHGMLS